MKDPEQFYLLQISKLEDELKAAQKDKARLDWMIKNKMAIFESDICGFSLWECSTPCNGDRFGKFYKDARDVIDAAIKAIK